MLLRNDLMGTIKMFSWNLSRRNNQLEVKSRLVITGSSFHYYHIKSCPDGRLVKKKERKNPLFFRPGVRVGV